MQILNKFKFGNRQKGIVMAVAMIFLAILSLLGLYTMRSSIQGEQVSKSLRSVEVATQAAEIALRYCEDRVRTLQKINIQPISISLSGGALPEAWRNRVNWATTSDISVVLPAKLIVASGMRSLPTLPRCMVERFSLPPAPGEDRQAVAIMNPYQITSIGYSADYDIDSRGFTTSGSEVWLQTVLIP